MPGHGAHRHKAHHISSHGTEHAKENGNHEVATQHPVVPMQKRKGPAGKDLEGLLSSAMLVTDKELGNVVHEIDEIAQALRSGEGDAEALRSAVHPAVWYAVKHVILERELRHLALTDDLTCLYNRRGFFAAAAQQMKLARRNGHGMLLFYCDLDNLKQINDSFGHREGDRALVRTADALEDVFRDSDILARLDGDEFAALALEASSRDEETILQRLDKSLHKANEKANEEEPRYMLSLSVGVARFDPEVNANLGDLMAQADRAMYERKKNKHELFSRNASSQ
jgi:diguanylate cyclase (GGDEF)-like protein